MLAYISQGGLYFLRSFIFPEVVYISQGGMHILRWVVYLKVVYISYSWFYF